MVAANDAKAVEDVAGQHQDDADDDAAVAAVGPVQRPAKVQCDLKN